MRAQPARLIALPPVPAAVFLLAFLAPRTATRLGKTKDEVRQPAVRALRAVLPPASQASRWVRRKGVAADRCYAYGTRRTETRFRCSYVVRMCTAANPTRGLTRRAIDSASSLRDTMRLRRQGKTPPVSIATKLEVSSDVAVAQGTGKSRNATRGAKSTAPSPAWSLVLGLA